MGARFEGSGTHFEGSSRHRLAGRRPGETEMLHIRKAKPRMRLRHKRAEEYVGEGVSEGLRERQETGRESEVIFRREEKEKGGSSLVESSSCDPDWRFRLLLIL